METTFATWLKQRRKELGVAQEELAERISCSAIMLRKLESGQRHPSNQIAQLLADYLGIPADEREAFITFARTGNASSPESSPSRAPWGPPSPGQSSRTNLPAPLTSFIGRERDLDKAVSYLLGPNVRLLTLTGAPGIGKTRLGLQVASDLMDYFQHGVFVVELANVIDPGLVLPEVARTLGLKEAGDQPAEAVLASYLRDRSLLLFLDNFEQVLDAAPAVVKLLESGPRMKALVTSREALHVRGEQRVVVPPLELPEPSLFSGSPTGSAGRASTDTVKTLASVASVQLFVERAQAVDPDFRLIPHNAQEVAEICVRLEGLPLAIELAAARVDHLSPHDMCATLNTRLKLLTEGARDLPPRQRTLTSAIEWSYDLLDADGQKALRRLSVFAGGCTLEAAEAVCAASGDLETSISEVLQALMDKHLLKGLSATGREGGQTEEPRFGMLEMIREYAYQKLWESEGTREGEITERAHALYFVEFAERAVSGMRGADGPAWAGRLESEHDNVREALLHILDRSSGNAEWTRLALRLSSAMGPFWRVRGYFSEGQDWLEQALAEADSVTWDPTDTRSRALRAEALNAAGWLAWSRGNTVAARRFFEEGLALYREIKDRQGIARLLNGLGQLALDRLSYEEAIAAYQEALAIARQQGDKSMMARTLNNLGNTYRNMSEYTAALGCYEESLQLYRDMQDITTMITPLNNLGLISGDLEDHTAARRYYDEALRLCQQTGNRGELVFTLAFVGMQDVEEGALEAARKVYAEAVPMARDFGYKLVLALCFEGMAALQQRLGQPLEAASLWGSAAAIRDEIGLPLPVPSRGRYERSVSAARSQADPAIFEAAWSRGRAMPAEEAVRYALEILSA